MPSGESLLDNILPLLLEFELPHEVVGSEILDLFKPLAKESGVFIGVKDASFLLVDAGKYVEAFHVFGFLLGNLKKGLRAVFVLQDLLLSFGPDFLSVSWQVLDRGL